jgi:hypothetical protein
MTVILYILLRKGIGVLNTNLVTSPATTSTHSDTAWQRSASEENKYGNVTTFKLVLAIADHGMLDIPCIMM